MSLREFSKVRTALMIVVLALIAAPLQAQQVCPAGLVESTPTERFTLHDNGTVSDPVTGLMWRRCTHGQSYEVSTNSCTGSITNLNWQSALQAAEGSDFAGHEDWRVPNVKELASLIEFACEEPAINLTAFPDTPSGDSPQYWTATIAPWGTSVFRVLFFRGAMGNGPASESSGRAARFVRDLD